MPGRTTRKSETPHRAYGLDELTGVDWFDRLVTVGRIWVIRSQTRACPGQSSGHTIGGGYGCGLPMTPFRRAAPFVLVGLLALTTAACDERSAAEGDSTVAVTVTVPADRLITSASSIAKPTEEAPAPPPVESVDNPYPYENTAPEISVAEDATPWPPPPTDPRDAVTAAVASAAAVGIEQSVVIIDRRSGAVLTEINPAEPYPALSLVKLMIAADVLSGGSTGSTDVDAATRTRLREMITRSDDVTAADFYGEGGGDELINRVVQQFSLTGSSPTPDGKYWGNVQTTAADMSSLITQILADPTLSAVIAPAMRATSAFAEDGVDQRFGMRSVPGAGSKQGWGCCLSGVTGVHSVGFTTDRIVVVLTGAEPDDYSLGSQDGLALQADPGGQVSIAAVTATVRAALGGP